MMFSLMGSTVERHCGSVRLVSYPEIHGVRIAVDNF